MDHVNLPVPIKKKVRFKPSAQLLRSSFNYPQKITLGRQGSSLPSRQSKVDKPQKIMTPTVCFSDPENGDSGSSEDIKNVSFKEVMPLQDKQKFLGFIFGDNNDNDISEHEDDTEHEDDKEHEDDTEHEDVSMTIEDDKDNTEHEDVSMTIEDDKDELIDFDFENDDELMDNPWAYDAWGIEYCECDETCPCSAVFESVEDYVLSDEDEDVEDCCSHNSWTNQARADAPKYISSVGLKFPKDKVSPDAMIGDIVSVDPNSDGLLVSGFRPCLRGLSKLLKYQTGSQKKQPENILDVFANEIQGSKSLLQVVSSDMNMWLVYQTETQQGHVFIVSNSAIQQHHIINHGGALVDPVLLMIPDTSMALVYFHSIDDNKNKVEVLETQDSLATVFGPAKVAGVGAGGCRAVIIDSKRAVISRVVSNGIEVIAADISKLPTVIMGSPVCLFSGVLCSSNYQLVRLKTGSEETLVAIAAPVSNSNSAGYVVSVIIGSVSLPGPVFIRRSQQVCGCGSIIPNSVPANCSIVPIEASGSCYYMVVYNDLVGLMAETIKYSGVSSGIPETLYSLSTKHAIGRIYVAETSGKYIVTHANAAKRKGWTITLTPGDAQPVSESAWSVPYSGPDSGAFCLTENLDIVLPNGSVISCLRQDDVATADKACVDIRLPTYPIGILSFVDDGSDWCYVVVHSGVYTIQDGAPKLQPGMIYYAHPDGSWSVDSSDSEYPIQLGICVTPDTLLICLQ